jgi:hypothetical protein
MPGSAAGSAVELFPEDVRVPGVPAVSLVMWAMTHRSVCRLPSTGTAKRASGSPAARIARSLSAMAAR